MSRSSRTCDPPTGAGEVEVGRPPTEVAARGLVVFTKPGVPGRVKTRLIGDLTAAQAATLHGAFLEDVLAAGRAAAVTIHLAWALEAGDEIPAEGGWRQEGEDLGERLFRGLRRAAERHRYVAAVGSDHPELTAGEIEGAFGALADGADVVFRPSDDGGYTLIGLRRAAVDRRLFRGIAWSTSAVLAKSLERTAELGLRTSLLPPGHDVDTPEDLRALVARLGAAPASAPATRRVLTSWGLLPEAADGATARTPGTLPSRPRQGGPGGEQ